MALISCPECETKVSERAISCPQCGCPIAEPEYVPPRKSRAGHVILGLLFGSLGFHNFYAGHNGRGAIKWLLLLVTLAMDFTTAFRTAYFAATLVILAVWSLMEVIIVNKDAAGQRMG